MNQAIDHHHAFELQRSHPIDALNLIIHEFTHRKTGAIHYHFETENSENVFLLGFRTIPMDHKGAAHILEHTALCGSKNYPVRDPFFMMVRRSLNTFMNAFTSNDWTAYPFASTNEKDFFNLLDVYLDAAFFANLNELDFLQEGHRVEFTEADNPQSPLTFKGVVFNEMKGAMSSISSTLWQSLCKHLFTDTTYHYNSGGDPEHITDLSYQELQDFYTAHYHPSNAMFATFGDVNVNQLQTTFEEKALQHFDKSDTNIRVEREPVLNTPKKAQEFFAHDGDDAQNSHHVILGWLIGCNTNLQEVMEAQLLSYVLMENSACPLQHFLETTDLGTSPSPMCGLEDSYHELIFCCGLQGAQATNADTFESATLDIFRNIYEQGISYERLSAIIHQLELSQREITGDGYPFGLQIILNALPSVTHRGDPIELLDLDPVLERMRESIKDPAYIKSLVKRLLLDNTHRVLLTVSPDENLADKMQAAEEAKLNALAASLSDADKQKIIDQTQALAERQAQVDDSSLLPKVGLADVPSDFYLAQGQLHQEQQLNVHAYGQATNGLSYAQCYFPLGQLSDDELELLPLYTQSITELGFNDASFQAVQSRHSETVGSINAFHLIRSHKDDEQQVSGFVALSAKALKHNQAQMLTLMLDTLKKVAFTDAERIKDLISQKRSRKENAVANAGHSYAMMSASSAFAPLAQLSETWNGLSSIRSVKALDDKLKSDDDQSAITLLLAQLAALHQKVISARPEILTVSEPANEAALTQLCFEHFDALSQKDQQEQASAQKPLTLAHTRTTVSNAWLCNVQVNFNAIAFATVPSEHPDSAALTVLGGFLRNGYLHTAIREQGGAYGAGATQDSGNACFKFYSYRDPRLSETLDDFQKAISWMLDTEHSEQALEEAILGVISSIDKPSSPAGEAKQAFQNELFGRDKAYLSALRNRVLAVGIEDLIRVTQTYLQSQDYSTAVVCPETKEDEVKALELNIEKL